MKLLDLFCGAGGCSMGYYRAGFTEIIGVDNRPQPRYPFRFVLADALEYLARLIESGEVEEYDLIHASPPCQRYSRETPQAYKELHPDLIGVTRDLLKMSGRPFVIENVQDARHMLINPVMLCGSMLGLGVWRHRFFELSPSVLLLTPPCDHSRFPVLITGTPRRKGYKRRDATIAEKKEASGISWMTTTELDEAIPPAYCEFIGRQLAPQLDAAG